MLKLQLFDLATEKLCLKSLVISPAVTKCTRIFFWKKNKANQMHGAKEVLKSVFWVKGLSKTSNKNLRSNVGPCIYRGLYMTYVQTAFT